MYAVALLLTSATLGVDFGWEPDNKGGVEYIIQIEPESLEMLKAGQPISMQLPPNLERVQCFRVQIGSGAIPRVVPASYQQEVNPTHTANLPSGDSITGDRASTGVPNLLLSEFNNDSINRANSSTPDISQAFAQIPGAPTSSIPNYGTGGSSYFNRGTTSSAAKRYGDATGNTGVTVPAGPTGSQFAPLPTATVPVGPNVGNTITPSWTSSNGYSSQPGLTLSPALSGVNAAVNTQPSVNSAYNPRYMNQVSAQNPNGATTSGQAYGRFSTPTGAQTLGANTAPPLNTTSTQNSSTRFQAPGTPTNRFSTTPTNTTPNTGYVTGTGATNQYQQPGTVPGYNAPNANQYNPQIGGQYNPNTPVVRAGTVSPNPVNPQQQSPVTQQTGVNANPRNAVPNYQNPYLNPNPNGYPAQQQPTQPLPNPQYQQQPPIYNTVSQPVPVATQPVPVIQHPVRQVEYVTAANPVTPAVTTPVPDPQTPAAPRTESQSKIQAPPAELTDKPWVLIVFFGAISVALNFWLGWMNFDIQTKYRELVQDVRDLKSITD
ncbi:MAG: hypothetical protein ACKVH8_06165 [Pirellulales bacterium]